MILLNDFFLKKLPSILRVLQACALLSLEAQLTYATSQLPSGIEHDPLDTLLQKYVDDHGLIDYGSWHSTPEDLAALKRYLSQFASRPDPPATGDELVASLINAYNAFTIEFILDNYPTESIRLLEEPFDGKRHRLGGELVSVDDIEHGMLRPIIGWSVHAVVVCAARSCPPLLNRAYRAETWARQMEERYRTWLAHDDLNRFDTGRFRSTVSVSQIFKWYADDYTGENTVEAVLRRFGPEKYREFLAEDFRITYERYHWGLNDQSDLGKDYRHNLLRNLF